MTLNGEAPTSHIDALDGQSVRRWMPSLGGFLGPGPKYVLGIVCPIQHIDVI